MYYLKTMWHRSRTAEGAPHMSEIAKHRIDGEGTASGTVSESVNPATGAVLGQWAEGGAPARAATAPEHGASLESSSDEYADLVTEGARRDAGEQPVRWLTAAEVDSWLSVVRLMTWLPWSIDQQLRRDSNLGMVEYQVLARLSNQPGRTLRMSSLADFANASLSRLSHLVTRLEARGLVRREPDPEDGRFTNAILTDKGYQTLAEAAPGHVAHVRSLVIDVLSPEQLRRLGRDADRIMSRIDTSAAS
jgi:DNA-binding MarR family transcriptional regulator